MKLILGDAYKEMKNIPEASIDIVFTDPPYNTTHNKWDMPFDSQTFFSESWRVLKPNGLILLWAQAPFSYKVVAEQMKTFRYEWIIEKNKATGFLNAPRMPMKCHENILVFYKKLPLYIPQMTHGHKRKVSTAKHKRNSKISDNYGNHNLTTYDSTDRYPRDVLKFSWDTQKSALHPTQKPIEACEYFIKTYSNPGDVILDPFMGSGSIGVSANNLGRDYIGIEKELTYFEISQSRIGDN